MAKSALVTGAHSGIGRATMLALTAQNYKVFAATLKQSEADELAALANPRIHPVVMDVASLPSIEAAIAVIAAALGAEKLSALVNIAGVNFNAPLRYTSTAEIQQMVNINLLGTMLLTHAALPLLETPGGRVVITGSATAFLPPPTISIYAATKCGLAGFNDSLRVELGMVGISVSLIEPGVVRTPLTARGPEILANMLARMSQPDRNVYEKLMRKIVDMSNPAKTGVPPEEVATAILHALTEPKPKSRYRVGTDSKIASKLAGLPDAAKDFVQKKTFGI